MSEFSEHAVEISSEPAVALRQFRARRRSIVRRDTDLFDAFYRVYVTGLIGLFGFYLALGLVDDVTLDAAAVRWVQQSGPGWVSLVAAVSIAVGARSGGNGGPLAVSDGELHHVLLSPLDRATALRDPVRRLLFGVAALGSLLGAGAGELASRQLPGGQANWALAGLLTGATIGLSGVGAALAAGGSGLSRRIIMGISLIPPTWAVADLATGATTSPTAGYGQLAMWPLEANPISFTAPMITLVLVGWGWVRIKGMSIERAHRRSGLVAQIRFAIAQQDIRSLLLLRRQLGFEMPRRNPWVTIRGGGQLETRFPVAVRDARSYARWPTTRLVRVGGLAIVAGLALAAMWDGTTALIAVVGASMYLGAIEVIEPLNQELDHMGILELIPAVPGEVMVAHVVSATAAMTGLWALAGAVATAVTLDGQLGAATAVAAIPASAAAVVAAALSIKRFDSQTFVAPVEVEGPRMLFRLLWPPGLTLAGALPVLVARNASTQGDPALGPTLNTAVAVVVAAMLGIIWIRRRDEILDQTTPAED